MKLNIVRKTLTGAKEPFAFSFKRSRFIVKNFSSGPALVSFDQAAEDSGSIKIPAGMGQVCYIVDDEGSVGVDTIYVKGTGEVEVQQI